MPKFCIFDEISSFYLILQVKELIWSISVTLFSWLLFRGNFIISLYIYIYIYILYKKRKEKSYSTPMVLVLSNRESSSTNVDFRVKQYLN